MDSNSMWLQESLVMPDPFPSGESFVAPKVTSVPKPAYPAPPPLPADDLLVRGDVADIARRLARGSEARPSLARGSTLGVPPTDEARRQVAQLLREKERWKTTETELTQARRQILDLKDEMRSLQGLFDTEKSTTELWRHRANEESKMRLEAEQALQEVNGAAEQKIQALQAEIASSKRELLKAQANISASLRSEISERVSTLERTSDTLRKEVDFRSEMVNRLKDELENTQLKLASTTTSLADANLEIENMVVRQAEEAQRLASAYNQQLEELEGQRNAAVERATQLSQKVEESQRRQGEILKQLSDTIEVLNERDSRLRSMHHDLEEHQRAHQEAMRSLQRVTEAKEKADVELKGIQDQLSAAREKISTLEVELRNTSQHTIALRELQTQLEGQLEAAAEEIEFTQQRLCDTTAEKDEAEGDLKEELRLLRERQAGNEDTWSSERAQWSRERMQLMTSESEARRNMLQLSKQLTELEASLRRQLRSVEQDRDYWRAQCDAALADAKSVTMEHQATMSEVAVLRSKVEQLEKPSVQLPMPRKNPRDEREPLAIRSTNSLDGAPPAKRPAVQGRVFAISGFDGKAVLEDISKLPDVQVVDLKANATVPTHVTHLVATGDITIKLLSALVRGCWILPARYVAESVAAGRWLAEEAFGFRHTTLPLMHKRIALTDKFASSRLCSTAELLLKEGGAATCDNRWEADYVLCHGSEASVHGESSLTWEKLVTLVYPRKIEAQ